MSRKGEKPQASGKDAGSPYVVFTPSGKRGHIPAGTSLLDAARMLGVDLDSVCGGRGICGRCQVILAEGEFAKHGITSSSNHVSAPSKIEARYAEKRGLAEGRRLGCSTRIEGDVVIDVPPESQRYRQLVRKRAELRDIEVDPLLRLCYVSVEEPDMAQPRSDLERLLDALESQWGGSRLHGTSEGHALAFDSALLPDLQKCLRAGKWNATAALYQTERASGKEMLCALWSGFHDKALGLAVDVGSTTIAAHLCDLSSGDVLASDGMMNPQIRFGEDLMSRVSYIMMNPDGDKEMTAAVREAVNELVARLCVEANVEREDILDIAFAGNPIMHHLLLGIDPVELGGAPFALASGIAMDGFARDIGISLNPGARYYALPCIAGHVGADAAAVILSEAPHLAEEITLIVDVGTNAEIILGNRERLLAASSPTGPAFEGAQISCGQRAAPGAIERVRIDRETLEPKFRIIGCDAWSNEEGFAEAAAEIGVSGICGSGIVEALGEMFLSGLITPKGVIDGTMAARTSRIEPEGRTFSWVLHEGNEQGQGRISITQEDVRAIQLAKAALHAGVRLLMDHLGVKEVERIVLAGAFGSHIDPLYALAIGLVPDCAVEKVASAGNAAGTGTRIALLNAAARAEIEGVVRRVEKVETAMEPRFQEHFVEAMSFPHERHEYPRLGKVVKLPEKKVEEKTTERRRRRRGNKES